MAHKALTNQPVELKIQLVVKEEPVLKEEVFTHKVVRSLNKKTVKHHLQVNMTMLMMNPMSLIH
ncbi:hypothetical protein PtB15_14B148 [Puccinia triticina]|nr:hypothetical protein PtB15_14B148 [Puccinia triticina]